MADTITKDMGASSAYAYAVEKGYTGTEEEFAKEQANFAKNAQQVATDRAATEKAREDTERIKGTALTEVGEAKTSALQEITQSGGNQIDAIISAGTMQVSAVQDAGVEAVGSINKTADERIEDINKAAAEKKEEIESLGLVEEVNQLSEAIADLEESIDGATSPAYAETVDDMTDTSKVYLGSNGNIWAYTKELTAQKTNQYNRDTAKFDYRVHPNYIGTENDPWRVCKGLVFVEIDGLDFTNTSSYIIRFNGVTPVRHSAMGITGEVVFFNQPSSAQWDFTGYTSYKYSDATGSFVFQQDDDGYYIDLMDASPAADTTRCYFGICIADNTSVSATDCENLFIEAVPQTTYTEEYDWRDTGIAYANYVLTDADADIIAEKVDKKINAVLYVDEESGNDANTGSKSNPLKTIQKAVDGGASLIFVKSGVYAETVTITRNRVHICLYEYPNFSTDVPRIEKIQVNNMVIRDCADITIEDVEVIGNTVSAFYAKNVSNLNMVECTAHDGDSMGFELYNVNGRFNGCAAYNLDYQGDPLDHVDGFNIHGYGYTEFINCSAWNCGDDGISHHDGCTGLISGGEFYGCGKGGVSSPANGAEITVDGVYSHDNVYGIYAVSAGSKAYIKNCVLKNNSYDLTVGQNVVGFAWNNIYDTKSISGGFTEFTNQQ